MTQQHFLPMSNVIQTYAWGSDTSFSALLGIDNPENTPQAELWMGAHPNGCSHVTLNNEQVRLDQLIAANPEAVLSASIEQEYGELPYLFKVLAAKSALSIQVHPSKSQAEQGFAKEDREGIPRNSDTRNYRDPNHKPELVYALTRYQAMNGFRPHQEILSYFEALDIAELSEMVEGYQANQNAEGLERFFVGMLNLEGHKKEAALDKLLTYAQSQSGNETFELIVWLEQRYPGDIGLFAPLMLHVLTLKPGEAMFLHACTPHAYCQGTGLEIMANSDNVLRAGLTPKHIDVAELASCTIFEPKARDELLTAPSFDNGAEHYPVPVGDFKFSVYVNQVNREVTVSTPEVLLALDAPVELTHTDGETLTIERGQSVFIPASAKGYTVSCSGKFARAYC
ncbi:mannose-6-phosphate isomerase, class I [Vibrio maritimus]|uniref:mannose-6-phosphate isomerase, class I n=1 Tax=Vibrio maritimus TaxID=990268 RepID=UPI0040684AFE